MPGKPKSALLPVAILLVSAGVIAALWLSRPQLRTVDAPEQVWPVDAMVVRHRDLQPEMALFGEAVAGRRSELRALVAGAIVETGKNFREGGLVASGEVLLRVDPFDYRTDVAEQQSLLEEARTRLGKLGRDLARAHRLHADNNVSDQFLDDARLAVDQQRATVEQREIALSRARRDLAQTRLVAPFTGVLSGVSADLGKQLSVNDKVAELIDTSRLEARFSLSNAQYGRLIASGEPLVGRDVRVVWRVGEREIPFPARIERVGAEIQSTTGGVDVYASIDTGGEQVALRPGAFLEVRMPDTRYQRVIRAPGSALYEDDIVYVVSEGRMSPRRVSVLLHDGTHVLLRSAGEPAIRDGDQLITTQLREGGAGALVEIR